MCSARRFRILFMLLPLASPSVSARADDRDDAPPVPWVDLLAASRSGEIGVEAEGTGDGRMTIRVANQSGRRLKVVLPPGLIASGATGQFAGLGGLGGIAGFGGVGGGLGGGLGGALGGGGNPQQPTIPPSTGLMMLGNSIMATVGHPDSWNTASMIQGSSGLGMMGAGPAAQQFLPRPGFRSVPPTDLPSAVIEPGQSRPLSTRLVSLANPAGSSGIVLPAAGERLQLGDVAELGASPRVRDALRRLARDKAPESVAQLALWGASGMRWEEIARASRGWANPHEITLARHMVDRLDRPNTGDPGRLHVEVKAKDAAGDGLAEEIRSALRDRSMMGLVVDPGVPARPEGPSVACRIRVDGTDQDPELAVEVAASDARGGSWTPAGKFSLPVARGTDGQIDGAAFGDSLAEELLKRLVVATIKPNRGTRTKGKDSFSIRVENYSPLILNGISLSGVGAKPGDPPRMLQGIGLSPRRFLTLPATAEAAERFGLKQGVRVVAVDLSAL